MSERCANGDLVPVEARTIDVAGVEVPLTVNHRVRGPELVVFVHGLGCTRDCFTAAWQEPALRDFSLLCPDLPGHGHSPAPVGLTCSMESYAATLLALLESESFERLHLVAHSMGGAVALLVTRDASLPLASFTNVEGNLVAEDCGMLSRQIATAPLATMVDGGLDEIVRRAASSGHGDLVAWASWAAQAEPRAIHEAAGSLVEWSDSGRLLDLFRDLALPKRYVCGSRSVIPSVMAKLGAIEQVVFEGAGHAPMVDQPARFYRCLADWLRSS